MTLPNYPDPLGVPDPTTTTGMSPVRSGAPLHPDDPTHLGYQPQPGYPGQPGWGPAPAGYSGYVYAPVRPTNGMAIAAMVTSIASLLVCYGLPGIVGALLGHSARKRIKETGEDGDGMALAGIIVGWIGFAISMLVTVGFVVFIVFVANSTPDYDDYSTY